MVEQIVVSSFRYSHVEHSNNACVVGGALTRLGGLIFPLPLPALIVVLEGRLVGAHTNLQSSAAE